MAGLSLSSALSLSMSPRGILAVLGTVLTVLPNGDVVVESIGSTWTMMAERLPGGEISVTGGSGAAVFRYSTDGGVTWTEGTSPGIINELGEVIIEALGDAVESDPVIFFEDTFAGGAGSLAGRAASTGGVWATHPLSGVTHLVSSTGGIYQDTFSIGYMTNAQAVPDADYYVEGDLLVKTVIGGGASASVNGRMDSAALTFYGIRYTGTAFILYKSVTGTINPLATYTATQSTGVLATMRLEMLGDQISGYVDGVLRCGPVTDADITAAGRVGTRIYGNGASATTGQHFEAMRAGIL